VVRTLRTGNDYLTDAEFSPDGSLVAIAGHDSAEVYDASTGRELDSFPSGKSAYSADFTPDGTRVVVASWDGTAAVYDVATGHRLVSVNAGNWVNSGAVSPDGTTFATASRNTTAQIWSTSTGALVATVRTGLEVFAVAFSPDGKRVLTTNDDGVQLWDLGSGRQVAHFPESTASFSASFSPDGVDTLFGGLIVDAQNGTYHPTVVVWNPASDKVVNRFVGPLESTLGTPAYSRDGTVVAIPDEDSGQVSFWCVATGKVLASFVTAAGNGVSSVAFSPNGQELLTADQLGVARIWRIETSATPKP
jgi:WD40 repeat protein